MSAEVQVTLTEEEIRLLEKLVISLILSMQAKDFMQVEIVMRMAGGHLRSMALRRLGSENSDDR